MKPITSDQSYTSAVYNSSVTIYCITYFLVAVTHYYIHCVTETDLEVWYAGHISSQQVKSLVPAPPTINKKCSHAYPSLVFHADISSSSDKVFHCVVTTFTSCNMQGSPLIERKEQFLRKCTDTQYIAVVIQNGQTITYVGFCN